MNRRIIIGLIVILGLGIIAVSSSSSHGDYDTDTVHEEDIYLKAPEYAGLYEGLKFFQLAKTGENDLWLKFGDKINIQGNIDNDTFMNISVCDGVNAVFIVLLPGQIIWEEKMVKIVDHTITIPKAKSSSGIIYLYVENAGPNNGTAHITITKIPKQEQNNATPMWIYYSITGGSILIVGAVAIFLIYRRKKIKIIPYQPPPQQYAPPSIPPQAPPIPPQQPPPPPVPPQAPPPQTGYR